jgi:thiol:disulfide interchange protein DsbD
MTWISSTLISALYVTAAPAAVRSGKATVEWLAAAATCEPGRSVQTAVRMVLDPSWHTYWLNPGEGGMKLSVEWELPAGWAAGELEHPVPKRFVSAGLAGFGYKGTVVFPVTLTAPLGFSGEAILKAKLSWLTCDDNSCIPGNAEISLTLTAGAPAPTAHAGWITEALKLVPAENPEVILEVAEAAGNLQLTIRLTRPGICDPASSQVYPLTHHAVADGLEIRFAKSGDVWTASTPRSGYADGPLMSLRLVLAGEGAPIPLSTTWLKK